MAEEPITMPRIGHAAFWLCFSAAVFFLLFELRSVLTPFVAGMVAAYFLDPVADRLEASKLSRTMATATITITFFLCVVGAAALIAPLIQSQIVDFAHRIPGYVDSFITRVMPMAERVLSHLSEGDIVKLREAAEGQAGTAVKWAGGLLSHVWAGGMALLSLFSLMFITPIVTFYLLRDWDIIVAKVDGWLPRRHAETIRTQIRTIDETIAGFVRGQALVCFALALYYGIGLSLVGLDIGLVVGIATGIAAFVPYVGAIAGFVLSLGLALAQFSDWVPISLVIGIFVFGQVLEGNILTPKLVGGRIGLHPVWITFALLAGGALFGFMGVLLAVPVAAIIGVLIRFMLDRYLRSSLYHGTQPK
jgi:predicted PurR-regulated permease PerM